MQKIIKQHSKNITSVRKNIKRHLTGEEKILRLSFKNITLSFGIITLSFLCSNSAFADTLDYSVTINPSLALTIPTSSLVLDLDPATKTFDSKDLNVVVGTNNATGYILTLSTPEDNTDLDRDTSSDTTVISSTISTLDTGTYTESTFTANKWGYKINSNTSIPSTITTGYIPFASGNTLMESSTAVNNDTTNLSFAAKIDYLQPAGAYATTLQFNIVANPLCNTTITGIMQTFNPCPDMEIGTSGTLIDMRDGKTYTIAKLKDGQIWMTSDLNLAGRTSLYSETSDVPAGYPAGGTAYYTLPASSTSGFSSDTGQYVYNSGNETTNQANCTSSKPCNSYYSWLVAVAGNKTNVTGNGTDAPYSICPKGWRLPKSGNQSDTNASSTTGYKKGDFYKLATAYGSNLESQHYQNNATFYNNAGPDTVPNFLLAGYYPNSSFLGGGSTGGYWSSSSRSSTIAYDLLFNRSNVGAAANYDDRRRGYSVRCLLK